MFGYIENSIFVGILVAPSVRTIPLAPHAPTDLQTRARASLALAKSTKPFPLQLGELAIRGLSDLVAPLVLRRLARLHTAIPAAFTRGRLARSHSRFARNRDRLARSHSIIRGFLRIALCIVLRRFARNRNRRFHLRTLRGGELDRLKHGAQHLLRHWRARDDGLQDCVPQELFRHGVHQGLDEDRNLARALQKRVPQTSLGSQPLVRVPT